jgi:V8-like Glu-specific endopeptidase
MLINLPRPTDLLTETDVSPRVESISLDALRQATPNTLWESRDKASTPAFMPPGTSLVDQRTDRATALAQTIAIAIGETESLKYPFRCIGQVQRRRPGQSQQHGGSGVLVGPWHLLTASHVLNGNPPGTTYQFYPAYWDEARYNFNARWYKANIINQIGINIDGVSGYDYLVCELDNPLGLDWGWLGTDASSNDDFYKNVIWTSIGYPSDLSDGKRPYGGFFNVRDVKGDDHNSKQIIAQGDVFGGWSGGPLYGPELMTGDTVVGVTSGSIEGSGSSDPDEVYFAGGKEMVRLVRYALDNWKRSDWSGWYQIEFPGSFMGDLAVCSSRPEHLQLFGVGTDGQMYSQYWLDDQGWSNWIPLGGQFNPGTNPAAICRKPNTVEVFCRGTDNTVWQNYWPYDSSLL